MQTPPSAAPGTPAAEVHLDDRLVRGLLADQHADLADLPLRHVEAGWDNATYRLGEALAVRLPRRLASADLIAHEQAWLPGLAARLPLPVPAAVRVGRPGRGYPWRWSVLPWLDGAPADLAPPADDQAAALAAFLRALHAPAPADAPANPVRGVPLATRAAAFAERMARVAARTDLIEPRHAAIWQEALAAPIDVGPSWIHGDLHPRNILVAGGAISGVIDWGDMAAGDRATDLAAIWMLFERPAARRAALAAYGPISDATLRRARGWALHLGLTLLDTGLVDTPRHAAIGERTLRRVLSVEC